MIELCVSQLKEIVEYNPLTGEFRWKKRRRGVRRLEVAGGIGASGYWCLGMQGKQYLAHRVAWAMVYEYWPPSQVDHINGNRLDNRIENLRLATHSQNAMNVGKRSHNTSGYKGVYWHVGRQKWRAHIRVKNKQIDLGVYCSREAAAKAYAKAAQIYHQQFAKLS